VVLSWTEFASECKSRLSAIARSCYLRREHWFEKYRQAKQVQRELREALVDCEGRCRRIEREREDLRRRVSELQAELARPRQIQLPLGEVPPGQQYGANMMALCVNLARKLGVRRTERGLKIFRLVGRIGENPHA